MRSPCGGGRRSGRTPTVCLAGYAPPDPPNVQVILFQLLGITKECGLLARFIDDSIHEQPYAATIPRDYGSTVTFALIIPIQHEYTYSPGSAGVNSMMFNPSTRSFLTPHSGMTTEPLQPFKERGSA